MSHRIRLRRASVRPVLQTEPGTLLDLIRGLNSLQVTMEACRARSARDACQPASKTASRGPTHSPPYTGCWGRWFIAVSDEAPEFLTSQPTLPIYIFRNIGKMTSRGYTSPFPPIAAVSGRRGIVSGE